MTDQVSSRLQAILRRVYLLQTAVEGAEFMCATARDGLEQLTEELASEIERLADDVGNGERSIVAGARHRL